MNYFKDRVLVIATMHGKEQVLQPLLEAELGVTCMLPTNFNSDAFGTFSGEIERELTPLETARQKCYAAMEASGASLAIASEGSFGAHPIIGFIPADEELLVLIDKTNNLEIKVKELSTATNFAAATIYTLDEAHSFAEKALFPGHGLIVKNTAGEFTAIEKGITHQHDFERIVAQYIQSFGSAHIETDMRAMYNPSRMKVIEAACKKLIELANSNCKQCNTPGFSVTDVIAGLPCSFCGSPTNSTKAFIYTCSKCNFKEEKYYPNGKETEDPMYCDRCNP